MDGGREGVVVGAGAVRVLEGGGGSRDYHLGTSSHELGLLIETSASK